LGRDVMRGFLFCSEAIKDDFLEPT
jgi:hypothetical protein